MTQHGDADRPTVDADMDGGLPAGPAGSWYTWWRDDPLPALAPLPGLTLALWHDADAALAAAIGLTEDEVAARRQASNRAYCARIDGALVGYGWVASARVVISEVRLRFILPEGHRYIWNCVTEPAWRGRGVYPRLLQAIIRAEMPPATHFWIGHSPDNVASGRGIRAAGFQLLLDFAILPDFSLRLTATGPTPRAEVAARMLGLALPPA